MMSAPSAETSSFLCGCGVPDMDSFLHKASVLEGFLYETNETFNLTSIPREDYWVKHVADSVSLVLALPQIASGGFALADLGCGAGFPSLVLAAAFPDLELTSIDSTRKKLDFVAAAAGRMGITTVRTVHGRGNELGRKPPLKGAFGIVCARAVSSTQNLLKEAGGLLSGDGVLAVYRTPSQAKEEFESLKGSKEAASWKVRASGEFSLPEQAGTRLFLLCERARS